MKKKLAKVLTAGVMTFCMVGCSSTTTEVIKAGTILDNPKDNLTSAERNNLRSKVIADQMWKNYYDEELNGAINYYPYKDDTEEIAKGLQDKLDSMIRHQHYTEYKTAETEEEKQAARQKYLDTVGMHKDFRW